MVDQQRKESYVPVVETENVKRASILSRLVSYQAMSTLLVFLLLILFFSLMTPSNVFISLRNIRSLLRLVADLGIVSLGIGLLMISGEFDLSISSTIPLCAYMFTLLLRRGLDPLLIILIILAIGPLFGLLNGLITTRLKLPSFIATLGTMMFWRGVLFVSSRRAPIGIERFLGEGNIFDKLFTTRFGSYGIPVQVFWFILFALILGIILRYHRFGNWVYATGDNREAAKAMGIDTRRTKIICFLIIGFLCAFVGMMQTVRIHSFTATQAQGFELNAIAAAVIGGTHLLGGVGSIAGVFLGVLTVAILENGLILMGVPVFGITAFTGTAVILAVIFNSFIERKRLQQRG